MPICTSLTGLRKATPLKTLARTSREKKRFLLAEAGVLRPSEDQREILSSKDEELADSHVDLYTALARWSLELEEGRGVAYVPLAWSRLLLEGGA